MTMKEKTSKFLNDIEADVCVVGSGAGGAVIAKELAEGGLQVVILEKGEKFTKYDFTQKEEQMFPRLYEDSGMRATHDQSIIVLHAKGVGGTTLINNNICFRAPDFVLDGWQQSGITDISPSAMVPHYEKVEKEISVRPIAENEVNRNDQVFLRGAKKLGLKAQLFNHNRKDCIGCGFCYCGCSYDRKQNMPLSYLPKAEDAGAQIFANTEADKIEMTGNRVSAILATQRDPVTKTIDGTICVRAKTFVIAGGAISTPIFLLRNGFGRLNRNIGQHLCLHPLYANIGVMEESIRFYEGISQCAYYDNLADGGDGGYLLEGIGSHPILTSLIIPSIGKKHRELMNEFEKFSIHYVMVKDQPQGSIKVSKKGAISIHYSLHEKDKHSLRKGLKNSAEIYFAAGAKKVYLNHVDAPILHSEKELNIIDRLPMDANRIVLYSAHQMSSCRMGKDPKTSATDSYGRLHGMDNLYVSDASLFPTSLGYNPQVTIMAIATRNANYILNQ